MRSNRFLVPCLTRSRADDDALLGLELQPRGLLPFGHLREDRLELQMEVSQHHRCVAGDQADSRESQHIIVKMSSYKAVHSDGNKCSADRTSLLNS